MIKKTSLYLILCYVVLHTLSVVAQKLPGVQKVSLRSPANLKIDGKATEWDNKFQAHNNATDIFYSLSNDDNDLYLVVQIKNRTVIKNAIMGGLKLRIVSSPKIDTGGVDITYPAFDKRAMFSPNFSDRPELIPGSTSSINLVDSFTNVTNQKMNALAKTIKVHGIKGVDTLISIYNDNSIKAASLFDNNMVYTYELSIALKDLGLSNNWTSTTEPIKLAYHIYINGMVYHGTYARLDKTTGKIVLEVDPPELIGSPPTDFSGEYILAKKP